MSASRATSLTSCVDGVATVGTCPGSINPDPALIPSRNSFTLPALRASDACFRSRPLSVTFLPLSPFVLGAGNSCSRGKSPRYGFRLSCLSITPSSARSFPPPFPLPCQSSATASGLDQGIFATVTPTFHPISEPGSLPIDRDRLARWRVGVCIPGAFSFIYAYHPNN